MRLWRRECRRRAAVPLQRRGPLFMGISERRINANALVCLYIHGSGDHVRPKLCFGEVTGLNCVVHVLKVCPQIASPKDRRDVFRSCLRSVKAKVGAECA